MKRTLFLIIVIVLLVSLAFVLPSLMSKVLKEDIPLEPESVKVEDVAKTVTVAFDGNFQDIPSLYDYDKTEVTCMYVTVIEGKESEGTNHSLEEVNSYRNTQDIDNAQKILAEAIVRIGDETGPLEGSLGYDSVGPNATINVRGRTSTAYAQKSYKLKLYDNAGKWNGMSTIALNKHPADRTRLRNMLYYTMMEEVPYLIGLRTYFVHLYVCDKTSSGDGSDSYVDYGLYTAVEQPNNSFLKTHGLGGDGYLYKSVMCEFYRYEDSIKLVTDPTYDQLAFERVLEPKTSMDHSKLIAMLDAVNDYSRPISEVLEQYFDVDNLLSYMAFNILMDNPDSNAQNYYIYSPVNSDKWYFICWDGDGALFEYENDLRQNAYRESEWSNGISNFWGNILFQRMLTEKRYRDMLTERVQYLHENVVTSERLAELIARFRTVTDVYARALPDSTQLKVTFEDQDLILENMCYDTDISYEDYMESIQKAMPFYLDYVEKTDSGYDLAWFEAYSFSNEIIRYKVQIANDYTFSPDSIVFETETFSLNAKCPPLESGTYAFRVTAINSKGKETLPFDDYSTSDGPKEGMRVFHVNADGSVEMWN